VSGGDIKKAGATLLGGNSHFPTTPVSHHRALGCPFVGQWGKPNRLLSLGLGLITSQTQIVQLPILHHLEGTALCRQFSARTIRIPQPCHQCGHEPNVQIRGHQIMPDINSLTHIILLIKRVADLAPTATRPCDINESDINETRLGCTQNKHGNLIQLADFS
jgi:hypothetical protein